MSEETIHTLREKIIVIIINYRNFWRQLLFKVIITNTYCYLNVIVLITIKIEISTIISFYYEIIIDPSSQCIPTMLHNARKLIC